MTGRREGRRRKLLDDLKEGRGLLTSEEESSGSHFEEISFWKSLWTSR
jgi:hypothetical protein